MIKIMLTVRNRLAITKKCIEALEKHSTLPYNLYVYDNLTNYKEKEHFLYFCNLYRYKKVTQVTFNTANSTFKAFSKAVASNQFGLLHEQDPNKGNYDFLLLLDNDIIVTPGWDEKLKNAWKDINTRKMKHVKVIGQLPGGIKNKLKLPEPVAGFEAKVGKLGGSGLWSVRPNFFSDVGYIDIKKLVGFDKKHDQEYWRLMDVSTNGQPYILGLNTKLGIHCGKLAGSVCNVLTSHIRDPRKESLIKFENFEDQIDNLAFESFYKKIVNDKFLIGDW